ncbi:hypothetical protein CQ062_11705 [Ochrobactrum sp. MYb68]|nr:hypothetical protein CQ062_11705 [Ochrobactrum sp. MYb68]
MIIKPTIPHIITIYEPSASFALDAFSERHMISEHVDLHMLDPKSHFLLFVGGKKVEALTEEPTLKERGFKWNYAADEAALTAFYVEIKNVVQRYKYNRDELREIMIDRYAWPESDFPAFGTWSETRHQMLVYYLHHTGNKLALEKDRSRKYAHLVHPADDDNIWNQAREKVVHSIHELARNSFQRPFS